MSTSAHTARGYTGEQPGAAPSPPGPGGPYPQFATHGAAPPPPQGAPVPEQGGFESVPPPQQPMVLVRRRSRWWGALVIVVGLVSVAALVLAILALTRQPIVSESAPPVEATTETQAPLSATELDALDTALCEEIGPLMAESNDASNEYINLGLPGTPERDAAIPGFRSATLDWADRTQAVLDEYADPPRFVTRMLQRFIDDMTLFVSSVRSGEPRTYDESVWIDATAAYGGPLARCQELGVRW